MSGGQSMIKNDELYVGDWGFLFINRNRRWGEIMTNASNLNLSKGTIPPLLKYKIVFLGDQAVGKSSIINRFIYDIFDGNDHVTYF